MLPTSSLHVDGLPNGRYMRDETVANLLGPYKKHIEGVQSTVLSKFTLGTMTASRKSAAKNDKTFFFFFESGKVILRGFYSCHETWQMVHPPCARVDERQGPLQSSNTRNKMLSDVKILNKGLCHSDIVP